MDKKTYWLTSTDDQAVQWREENPGDVEKYDLERRQELAAIFGIEPNYFPNWREHMAIDQERDDQKAFGPRVHVFRGDEPDE